MQNYLKFEKSVGDPARVQVLYERAMADFPISIDLWLDYTRYLDRTLKVVLEFLFSQVFPSSNSVDYLHTVPFPGRKCSEGCLFQGNKKLSLDRRALGSVYAFLGTWPCS